MFAGGTHRAARTPNRNGDPTSPAEAGVLRLGQRAYPGLLAQTADPPTRLFYRGDPSLLARPAVAVVGSRSATALGLQMGERLGAGLAERGVVVVSGCAIGVDAAAHRGALSVGGETVAVLAGGLDVSAPASNRALAEHISARGCLVAEHEAGTQPRRYHFPHRNRIIAGLSRIVVVVEAAARSGALITARLALESGREAMAVPGHPLLATSAGVNALLADGARPVRSVEDVMEELEALPGVFERDRAWRSPASRTSEPSSRSTSPTGLAGSDARTEGEEEVTRRVLAGLSAAPVSVEPLAETIGVAVDQVLAALTRLELIGLARAHPGQRFTRTRKGGRED